jgi:shikimate dehydrogenase
MLDAERLGIPAVNGLGMLVAQAKAASERFRDISIPDYVVEDITREIEKQTKNLILVGMPGCGKSTIGRKLAARLDRPLVDTDEEIVKRIGCTIPEYFASHGEEEFRKREHEVLRDFSGRSGQVIATGGGIVTRPENMDSLRENSMVVFLRREIGTLPTRGRPISQSNDLYELYEKRRPLYEAAADVTVDNIRPEQAVEEILNLLK